MQTNIIQTNSSTNSIEIKKRFMQLLRNILDELSADVNNLFDFSFDIGSIIPADFNEIEAAAGLLRWSIDNSTKELSYSWSCFLKKKKNCGRVAKSAYIFIAIVLLWAIELKVTPNGNLRNDFH